MSSFGGDLLSTLPGAIESAITTDPDDDSLIGGLGDNRLSGLAGNDSLAGSSNDDVLDGAHNPDALAQVARTLEDEFAPVGSRLVVLGQLAAGIPASLGWRVFGPQDHDADQVLKDADQAMYAQKAGHRLREHAVKPLLFTTARHLALDQLRRHGPFADDLAHHFVLQAARIGHPLQMPRRQPRRPWTSESAACRGGRGGAPMMATHMGRGRRLVGARCC